MPHIDKTITLERLDGYFYCPCGEFKDINPDNLRVHVKSSCPSNNDPPPSAVRVSPNDNFVSDQPNLNCLTQVDDEGCPLSNFDDINDRDGDPSEDSLDDACMRFSTNERDPHDASTDAVNGNSKIYPGYCD